MTEKQQIFKYRDWENPYHKKLLTQQELFFAHVSSFNDPFDEGIPYRFDKLTPELFADSQVAALSRLDENITPEELESFKQEAIKEYVNFDPKGKEAMVQKHLKKIQDGVGVVCFCYSPSNINMWSYYGADHKGFCLGIDGHYFDQFNDMIYKKINYSDSYPEIIPGEDNTENYFKSLTTKYGPWSIEDEIRLFKAKSPNTVIKMPKEILLSIYFGCRTTIEHKQEIIEYCKDYLPHIQFFDLRKNPNKFQLDRYLLTEDDLNKILSNG